MLEDRIMEYSLAHLVEIENESIREFVASYPYTGRVLDYGCGLSPYRDLIEPQAQYVGYDRPDYPANMSREHVGGDYPLTVGSLDQWDAIVCTQVVQFVPNVYRLLRQFRDAITPGGALVLTGPTCWPEVNDEDIHRHTRTGISALMRAAGFEVEVCEERAAVVMTDFRFSLGYGCIGRA